MLITGGLGALGVLTALWAALGTSSSVTGSSGSGDDSTAMPGTANGSGGHIRLLSRGGRPGRDALQPGAPLHALLSGMAGGSSGSGAPAALVTMQRCDAAAAEDAADVLRLRSSAASTMLHAAGVLQVTKSDFDSSMEESSG